MTSLTARAAGAAPTRAIITVCAMIATLMQALDATIANVALPYMQGSLSATPDQITWVLTGYIVAAAIMTAPVGWLSARLGRKRLFILCLAGFIVASMLCGLATTLYEMVAFRVLQGVFGAALVPLSQATMLDLYPPERRGQAMAIWGMGVMVGPILGPTLGGYLTEFYTWPWVFYVNVPFGVLAILGLLVFMPEDRENGELPFDWQGFAYLSLGLAALQILLDRGELVGWFGSSEIVIEAVLAGLGFYLFVVHSMTAARPLFPLRAFRDANFSAGLLVMFAVGVVLLATSALLAPYLQELGGYPVETAGLLMTPRGFGTMAAMFVAGRLSRRVDPRLVMLFGVVMIAWSLWDMTAWTPDVSAWTLSSVGALQGFGLGFVFIPLQVVAFSTLAPDLRPDGTALMSLMRNVGSAIGISVVASVRSQQTQIVHSELVEHATPFNRLLQEPAIAHHWDPATAKGAAALNEIITEQASIIAYVDDFKLMLLVCLPMALLLLLMRRSRMAPAGGPPVMD